MNFNNQPTLSLSHLPTHLVADIRSDHAGETGAVFIYKGILAITQDPHLRAFAQEHLQTEQKHLALICALLPPQKRSLLLPGWQVAGFLTGALPALAGPQAVYATIKAVEIFVDQHYQNQINLLKDRSEFPALLKLLEDCQADEVEHRDQAAKLLFGPPSIALRAWCMLVSVGSAWAVKLARLI